MENRLNVLMIALAVLLLFFVAACEDNDDADTTEADTAAPAEEVADAGEELGDAGAELGDAVEEAAEASQDDVAAAGDAIQGGAENAAENIEEGAETAAENIEEGAETVVENIQAGAESIEAPDVDAPSAGEVAEDVGEAVEEVGDAVEETTDELADEPEDPNAPFGSPTNPLTVSLVQAPSAPDFAPLRDRLAQHSGLEVATRTYANYSESLESLCSGAAEVALLDAVAYVAAREAGCTMTGYGGVQGQRTSEPLVLVSDGTLRSYQGLPGSTLCRPQRVVGLNWELITGFFMRRGVDINTLTVQDVPDTAAAVAGLNDGTCDVALLLGETGGASVLTTVVELPLPIFALSADLTPEQQTTIGMALGTANAELMQVYGWDAVAEVDATNIDAFQRRLDQWGVNYQQAAGQ
ncbi:MAG: PhnD/SsuA/transferrin family substrate-binding protein [Anaerolineae bacterium]|nr:PhnD/SsuA/transferrin family substrate-binding protein [Anaerolineae bacterium]